MVASDRTVSWGWASTIGRSKSRHPVWATFQGYCDPWWYVCYPGGFVPVENVVGERSSTDFGMDFGGGVNFGVIYAEVRYHYIWGPTVAETGATQPLPGVGAERKANGQFLQTTFGVRF
jgi:hypothetical protein